jgi:Domain of unknown function (DUF4406)
MKKKIYIIGTIPTQINANCELKFYKVQMKLLHLGFQVINPVERLMNNVKSREFAVKTNLHDLMFADGVFIMPCVDVSEGKNNIEIKIALDFNLFIINGLIDLPDLSSKNVQTSFTNKVA